MQDQKQQPETIYFYYGKNSVQYCTPNETLAFKRAKFYGSEVFILSDKEVILPEN